MLRDCKKVLARPALLIRSPEYRMNQPEPIPLLRSVPGAGQPREGGLCASPIVDSLGQEIRQVHSRGHHRQDCTEKQQVLTTTKG